MQTCQVPGRSFTVEKVGYPGGVIFEATGVEYEHTINMSFIDDKERSLLSLLNTWQELVYDNESGTVKDGEDYKKTVTLSLGNKKFKLEGCIPLRIDTMDLDKASKEFVKLSFTIQYDRWMYVRS